MVNSRRLKTVVIRYKPAGLAEKMKKLRANLQGQQKRKIENKYYYLEKAFRSQTVSPARHLKTFKLFLFGLAFLNLNIVFI